MVNRIRIGDRYYLSLIAKIILTFVVLGAYYSLTLLDDETIFILGGIVISPSIPAIWMSRYVTELTKETGFSRFVWILGKKVKVDSIEDEIDSIEIKKIQQYPGLLGLYLIFSSKEPKCVITSYEYESLLTKAQKIESKLNLKLNLNL